MKGRLCLVDGPLDSQPCFLSGTCWAISVLSLSPEITAMWTTANHKQDKLRTDGDAVSRAVGLAGWFRAAASTAGLPFQGTRWQRVCFCTLACVTRPCLHNVCSRTEKWEEGGSEAEVTSGIMGHCGGERATGAESSSRKMHVKKGSSGPQGPRHLSPNSAEGLPHTGKRGQSSSSSPISTLLPEEPLSQRKQVHPFINYY